MFNHYGPRNMQEGRAFWMISFTEPAVYFLQGPEDKHFRPESLSDLSPNSVVGLVEDIFTFRGIHPCIYKGTNFDWNFTQEPISKSAAIRRRLGRKLSVFQ